MTKIIPSPWTKRALAMLLALVMLLGMLPTAVIAEGETEEVTSAGFYFDESGNMVRSNVGKDNTGDAWTDSTVRFNGGYYHKVTLKNQGSAFVMRLDEDFLAGYSGGVRFTMEYYDGDLDKSGDDVSGQFCVRYTKNTANNSGTSMNSVAYTNTNGTGGAKKLEVDLSDMTAFTCEGYHIKLECTNGNPLTLYIKSITVTKLSPEAPVNTAEFSFDENGSMVCNYMGKDNDGTAWTENTVEKDGIYYRKTTMNTGSYFPIKLHSEFLDGYSGGVHFKMEYYDGNLENPDATASGQIRLQYSKNTANNSGTNLGGVNDWRNIGNTNEIKVYEADITDMTAFTCEGYHLKMACTSGPAVLYIKSVTVTKLSPEEPVNTAEFHFDENGNMVRNHIGKENTGDAWAANTVAVVGDYYHKVTLNNIGSGFVMKLSDAFMADYTDGVRFTMEYYDGDVDNSGADVSGQFRVRYTKNTDKTGTSLGNVAYTNTDGTGGAKKLEVDLRDMTAVTCEGYHIKLECTAGNPLTLYIKSITVTKLEPINSAEFHFDESGTMIRNHIGKETTGEAWTANTVQANGEYYHKVTLNNIGSGFVMKLDSDFLANYSGGVRFAMEYYDGDADNSSADVSGQFRVRYTKNTANDSGTNLASLAYTNTTGSGGAKKIEVDLPDMTAFTCEGYHLKVECSDGNPLTLYIKSVTVTKLSSIAVPTAATADFTAATPVLSDLKVIDVIDKNEAFFRYDSETTSWKLDPGQTKDKIGYLPIQFSNWFFDNGYTGGMKVTVEYLDKEAGGKLDIAAMAKGGNGAGDFIWSDTLETTGSGQTLTQVFYLENMDDGTFEDFHIKIRGRGNPIYIKKITAEHWTVPEPQPRSDAAVYFDANGNVVMEGIKKISFGEGETALSTTTIDGAKCWTLGNVTGSTGAPLYMNLNFDRDFLANRTGRVLMEVEYYDNVTGHMEVCYINDTDNVTTDPPAHTGLIEAISSGKGWQTAKLEINDMTTTYIGSDYHVRLGTYTWTSTVSPGPMYIKSIKFTKLPAYTIDAEVDQSKNPGLIFKDTAPSFEVKLNNLTDAEQTFQINSVVKDYSGNTIWSDNKSYTISGNGSQSFTPGMSSVNKYGTYTLEVTASDAEGNYIRSWKYNFSKVWSDSSPMDFIGTCTHFVTKGDYQVNMPLAAEAGIKYWRDDFTWSRVEKTKGVYTVPEAWDTWVDYSIELGMEPMPILDYGNSAVYGSVDPTNQDWVDGYVNYCKYMIKHYKDKIEYFEIWNEWNIGLGDVPKNYQSAEYYASVLYQVAKAIKSDPETRHAKLIAGATSQAKPEWTAQFLDYEVNGDKLSNYIDAISYHPYIQPNDPDTGRYETAVDSIYNLLVERNLDLEIWITETGYPTTLDSNSVTEEMAGAYLVRMYTNMMGWKKEGKVDAVFWYDFQNDGVDPYFAENNFGLIRTWQTEDVPHAAKVGYATMSAMTSMLSKATYTAELNYEDGILGHRFEAENGSDIVVLWCSKASKSLTLTVNNQTITMRDMYGNASTLTSVDGKVTVPISDYPVYLTCADYDQVEVTDSGFVPVKNQYIAAPGSTVPVQITRRNGFENLSGTYGVTLPSGWSTTGSLDFAAQTDTVNVVIPANCESGKNYTVTVAPSVSGVSAGTVTVNIMVSDSVLLNPVYVNGQFMLEVKIPNEYGEAISGSVTLNAPSDFINANDEKTKTFSAGAGEDASVLFAVPQNLSESLYTVQVSATVNDVTSTVQDKVSFLYAAKGAVTVDGVIGDDWTGAMAFTMGQDTWGTDQNRTWTDETAKGYLKWDEDNLYLAVEVEDDDHYMPETNPEYIWRGDNVQIAIDPGRQIEPDFLKNNEIGFSLNSVDGKVYAYKWRSATANESLDSASFQVARDEANNKTVYEAALPWDILMPEGVITDPESIGISVVVNCGESGTGRIGWIKYMDGLASGKDVTKYGDLVLSEYHVHAMTHHDAVPATCKATGNVEYWTCDHADCANIYYTDANGSATYTTIETVVDPNKHVGGTVVKNAVTATEDQEGYTGDTYCASCDALLEKGATIPKLDHKHTMTHHEAVAATCSAAGTVECWSCSGCNKNFSDEEGKNELNTIVAEKNPLNHSAKLTYEAGKRGTCTEEGIKEHWTCSGCGKNFADAEGKTELTDLVIPASGHTMSHYEAVAATCTTAGNVEYWLCRDCNGIYYGDANGNSTIDTVVIPATGHTTTKVGSKDANCYETGIVEHWKCSACQKNFADEAGATELTEIVIPVNKDNHAGGTKLVNQKAPTDTEEGYTGDTVCAGCGVTLETGEVIGKLVHTHKMTHHEAVPSTCCENGTREYWTCHDYDDCKGIYYGKEDGSVILSTIEAALDPTNHSVELVHHNAVEATCTAAGNVEYWSCSGCGKNFADEDGKGEPIDPVTSAVGHSLSKTEAVAATCKDTGNSAYWSCSECGKFFSDAEGKAEIEKDSWITAKEPNNHTGDTDIRDHKEATETEEGYTGDTYCLGCNQKIATGTAIPKKDHVHNMTYHDAVAATCKDTGKAEYWSCDKEACNGIYYGDAEGKSTLTDIVTEKDPDNHAGGTEIVGKKEATTEAEGYTGDEVCKGCGTVLKKGEAIPKLEVPNDRDYVEIKVEAGKTVKATQNGLTEAMDGADITVANAEIVSVTMKVSKKTTGVSWLIGWFGSWGGGSTVKTTYDHTITFKGLKAGTTEVQVGEVWYRVTVTEAHVHSYTAKVTEATCTEKGYTTYTCACGEHYKADYVDALGHSYVNGICERCGKKKQSTIGDLIGKLFGWW